MCIFSLGRLTDSPTLSPPPSPPAREPSQPEPLAPEPPAPLPEPAAYRRSCDFPNPVVAMMRDNASRSPSSSEHPSRATSSSLDTISEARASEEGRLSEERLAEPGEGPLITDEQAAQLTAVMRAKRFKRRSDVDRFLSQVMGKAGHTPTTHMPPPLLDPKVRRIADEAKQRLGLARTSVMPVYPEET